MSSETTQTILLSLVGTAPAVLTETVWALANLEESVVPDRIIAFTTTSGAARLKKKLFEEERWNQMIEDLKKSRVEVDGRLLFGPIADSIRVFPDLTHSRELEDIRSSEDNQAVAEFFMEVIRGFAENENIRLIVSIAGGRKTTSAMLHSVMTLLGRAEDRINHILVGDEWVAQQDFFYPGCEGEFIDRETGDKLNSSAAVLELVDVPFVPLRYLFKRDLERSAGSFLELMNQLRTRTLNIDEDLIVQLDTTEGQILVSGRAINPSANEFLLYSFFAIRAKQGLPPVASFVSVSEDLLDLRSEYLVDGDLGHWSQKSLQMHFDPKSDLRKWTSSIRSKMKNLGLDPYQINRLVPKGGRLSIDLPGDCIEIEP